MADILEIRRAAYDSRMGFIRNTINLDERQLLMQIETLGECKMEDESREGQIVTQRCIDFVMAVGAFKYPNTWRASEREHFVGAAAVVR